MSSIVTAPDYADVTATLITPYRFQLVYRGMFEATAQTGYTARMTSDLLINSPWADHSSADTAAERAEADRVQHDAERLRAVRVIAAAAHDATEARDLLSMLGLSTDDIRAAR